MIDAVIFDFDGLIVDTEGCDYKVWKELYQQHGLVLTKDLFAGCIGALDGAGFFNPYQDFQEKIGESFEWDRYEPERIEKIRQCTADLPLLPGVAETIHSLKEKGIKIGLASSSNRDWVYPHLDRLGLRQEFNTIKCREDAAEAKPAPDLYLAALADLGAAPVHSLALEDSLYGAQAAKKAGMFCVLVTGYLNKDQIPAGLADVVMDSLADQPLEWILNQVNHG